MNYRLLSWIYWRVSKWTGGRFEHQGIIIRWDEQHLSLTLYLVYSHKGKYKVLTHWFDTIFGPRGPYEEDHLGQKAVEWLMSNPDWQRHVELPAAV